MGKTPPKRQSPVHHPVHLSHDIPTIVFITVCTTQRRAILANEDVIDLIVEAWKEAKAWSVGRFVIMPDHIHLFAAPTHTSVTLERWIQYWKSLISRQWPRPGEQPIWQRSFWDTQLRRGENYREKWEYVRNNPVRAGLCHDPDAWPYQGEMNILDWHD